MPFKILAVDGGGVRGIFPAHLLASMAKHLSIEPSTTFDLIAGTSTGAIVAANAALGLSVEHLVAAYERYAKDIFRKRSLSARGWISSAYGVSRLQELLVETFWDKTMSDAKTRLMLPATDVSNGNVFVIKSPYLREFVRDQEIRVADAVMASCAAPTFFDPMPVKDYLLADGGIWANNPSLVAYVEAVGKLEVNASEVRILSLGTGSGHQWYDLGKAKTRPWGLATGWQGTRLIDLVFNLQSRSATNMTGLLLKDRYLRLGFEERGRLRLDDVGSLPRLKAKAAEVFAYHAEGIQSFLQ